MIKNIEDSFRQKLYECNKHIEKLNDAKEYLEKDIVPFNQDEVVDGINLIYAKSDELIEVYQKLYKFVD